MKTKKSTHSRPRWKPPKDMLQLEGDVPYEKLRQDLNEISKEIPKWAFPIDAETISAAITDDSALEIWVDHIEWEILIFQNFVESKAPEVARRVAAKRVIWPVLGSANSKVLARNEALFEKLGLGSSVSPVANAETIGIVKKPAKKWACQIIEIIEIIRLLSKGLDLSDERWITPQFSFCLSRGLQLKRAVFPNLKYTKALLIKCVTLPPFSDDREVIEAWWIVAQDVLMLNTDGEPEFQFDELYQIGWYRERHTSSWSDIATTPGESPMNQKSADANVRAAMFKRLKKEFYSIAKNLPKTATTTSD